MNAPRKPPLHAERDHRFGGVRYDAVAVEKEIRKDKRISKREARLIHALLRGRA